MQRTLFVLILIGLALPALAVGKGMTDPNALGAAASNEENVQATDARLSKKVTISEARMSAAKILDELSKSSGIVLKAGVSSADWQVRDRKMSIFAKELPLVELMNSISHVMKFKWERKGDEGKWTYRLYMDRRTLLNAEAQRARAEAKEAADQARRRQDALESFGKLSGLSEADKAKLRNENPFLYAVSKTGWGDSLAAFLREVPAASEALASGQKTSIDAARLTPTGRTGLLNAMKAELDMENRFGGSGPNSRALPENLDPAKVTIAINESIDSMPDMPGKGAFLGEVNFRYDGGTVSVPFLNPDSDLVKFVGKMLIECDEQRRDVDDVIKEHASEMAAAMVSEIKSDAGGEPENEHPDDPSLQVKVKLNPDSDALFNVEKNLAEASKLCVVSDYFQAVSMGGVPKEVVGPPRGEMELKTALEKIGDFYVYNWDKRDSVVELRDRNWFRKRAAQIPDAWLEKWRDELKTTGTIDIDNLSQIAQLTQEQYSANVLYDEVLSRSNLVGVVASSRELLRFYASLSPDQRAAVSTDFGLDVLALSADQSDQFAKLLKTRDQNRLTPGKRAVMTCSRSQVEKAFFYSFKLLVDGKMIGQWNVGTAVTFGAPTPDVGKAAPPAQPSEPAPGMRPAK